jgi:hypothetical protein
MTTRIVAATVTAAAAAAAAVMLVSSGASDSSSTRPADAVTAGRAVSASAPATRSASAREDCSTRSEARFPGGFSSPGNLVVGPLLLIGGAYTDAATVREYGGNKFPVLVKAGHTVTVRLSEGRRGGAGLAYGPLPQGRTRLRDAHGSVTFVACRPGRAPRRYRPDGPSASDADGVAVTFWSGFVLTREPACVPLDIYVDDEPTPRHVGLSLGRRCARASSS